MHNSIYCLRPHALTTAQNYYTEEFIIKSAGEQSALEF